MTRGDTTAASSSWTSASLAPETSAPPTPQITNPSAKAPAPEGGEGLR